MGTDALGRSVLNLTVWGTRISMVIGLLATIITVVLGALVGIVSGFVGGRTDQVLMRITDLFLVLRPSSSPSSSRRSSSRSSVATPRSPGSGSRWSSS